jgi:acyl-CoA reductase-like NAD-dependent aldehyde dehydrogenase
MRQRYGYWLAGQEADEGAWLEVRDKFTGDPLTEVATASPATIERAIQAAGLARAPLRRRASSDRRAVLDHCVERLRQRADEFADALCGEAGKPIRDSRGEVARLIETFQAAAEESVRMGAEGVPLDGSPRARGYRGYLKRVPIGVCSFIAPFNFPLNLVAHKVAPALAVGCPFILKPASATPVGALLLGEILAETDLPRGSWSILPCSRDGADLFTEHPDLALLSFTGSPEVGWALKARAGKKKVVLELGGNAAVIVDEDADLEDAVERILVGAFYQSGQSCIGVQRILVHERVNEAFKRLLVERTRQLVVGDPRREETFVGPLISERDAQRLQEWIAEAEAAGGRILTGGGRTGACLEPTLLEAVPRELRICTQEAFGPVAVLSTFASFDEALAEVNDSAFGLQAGVFTRDLYRAQRAWDELEVGGVVVGDVPSWRVDTMPYGGVKDSGLGREGVRYAMEDMTEPRLLVVRTPPGE